MSVMHRVRWLLYTGVTIIISAIVATYGGIRTRLEYNLIISYKIGLFVYAIILDIDRTLNLLS